MKKNTDAIVKRAKEKAIFKRKAVIAAIERLNKAGRKINFSKVANEASVSRNYLYKTDELRDLIEFFRGSQSSEPLTYDVKDIVIASQARKIKELEEKLIELEK